MEKVEFFKKLGLAKKNYQGKIVPVGMGIIFVIGSILSWIFFLYMNFSNNIILVKLIFLTAITGSAGLLDDIKGSIDFKGFKGHFNALISGTITTGIIKGAAVSLASFFVVYTSGGSKNIIDAGIIILISHFHNLLDLRPGRTLKFFLIFTVMIIFSNETYTIYFIPLLIIIVFYGNYDLKGKVMLGDTGSYTLGIIAGYMAIESFSHSYRKYIFGFFLIMLVLSEFYSFSKYIKRNKILNWLDMLGR